MRAIPLSRPFLNQEMRDAALRALDSGRYILDRECRAFEEELAAYIGMRHAVLSSSWTAAMLLLHESMKLQPGDDVLVPSLTAFPTIEPLIHCGARPVFVDIDDSCCIDPALLERTITPRTVGIMPVHLYGRPANIAAIMEIAQRRRLWVIEDCAQAHGARHQGRMVGTFGVAAGFSFFPSKNLSVPGDGGCIATNDDGLAEQIRMLRNHGRRDKYLHERVGYNLRFNEIQAAVGRVALHHLDSLNQQRRDLAALYDRRLGGIVGVPATPPTAEPVYHIYAILTPRRDDLASYLRRNGIETGVHYPVPNHQQPAIRNLYSNLPSLPKTEKTVGELLSLPIFPGMTGEEIDIVCDHISDFFEQYDHAKP